MDEEMTPAKDSEQGSAAKLQQDGQPVEEQTTESQAGKIYTPKQTSNIGRWLLILLATLIVGFGAAFFSFAMPARQSLRQSQADLVAAQEKLTITEADLTTANDDLIRTRAELDDVQFGLALARVQVNIAYARSSLVSRDLLTARQEVSTAVDNLQLLLPYITDADVATALSDRMDGIDKSVYTDSTKALEELRTLSENLLRLEGR